MQLDLVKVPNKAVIPDFRPTSLISLAALDSFPPGEALGAPAPVHAKFYPQGLWNVERQAVEKLGAKISSTVPVENFYFSTLGLWKKSC